MNGSRDIPTPDQPPTFPPVGGRTLDQYLTIYEGAFTEVGLRSHWYELQGIAAAGGASAPGPVSITQAMLVKPSVGEPELFTSAVSTRVLADNAVTDGKIVSLAYAKLTGAPTGLPPVGTAGGHLTGTYPNPTIKAGVVGDPQISFVTGGKISIGTVTLDRLDPAVQVRFPPVPSLPTDYGRVLTVDPGTGLLIWLPPMSEGGGGGGGDSLWTEDLGTQMLSPIHTNTGIALPRSGGDGIVFQHTNYPTVDRRTGIAADDSLLILHAGSGGLIFKPQDSTSVWAHMTATGLELSVLPTLPMHAATKQYVDANVGGIPEAPTDGQTYGRRNLTWTATGTNLWLIEPTAKFVKLDVAITASNSGILLDDDGYYGYRFKHDTLDTNTWMTGVCADQNFLYVQGAEFGVQFRDSAGGNVLAQLQADGGFFPNYLLAAPTARVLAGGANHNLNPGGQSILSVSAPSFASITGIVAGYAGRLLWLFCTGANAIDINIENALSTANNRIQGRADQLYGATDPTLRAGGYMLLRYAGNPINRWQIMTPQPVGQIYNAQHLINGSITNTQLGPSCVMAANINPAPVGADVGKVLTVDTGVILAWKAIAGAWAVASNVISPADATAWQIGIQNPADGSATLGAGVLITSYSDTQAAREPVLYFRRARSGQNPPLISSTLGRIEIWPAVTTSLFARAAHMVWTSTDNIATGTRGCNFQLGVCPTGSAAASSTLDFSQDGKLTITGDTYTMKATRIVQNTAGYLEIISNVNGVTGSVFGSPIWLTRYDQTADVFQVRRHPPSGGAVAVMATVTSAGDFSLPVASASVIVGSNASKGRLHGGSSFPTAFLSLNRTPSNAQDDATKPSWFLMLDGSADQVQITRSPPGDTSTQLIALKLDNAGNLTLPGPNFLQGSPIKTLIQTLQAAPSTSIHLNNGWAPDDMNKCSLALVMDGAVAPNPGFYFYWRTIGAAAGAMNQIAQINSGGGFVISGSTGQKATGTTWSNPSDRRIKDEITDYPTGLSIVTQLLPRTFVYNGKGGSVAGMRGYGFIADEVAAVMPEMVGTTQAKLNVEDEELTDIQTVDQSNLILALVNGMKELAARVAALEATV